MNVYCWGVRTSIFNYIFKKMACVASKMETFVQCKAMIIQNLPYKNYIGDLADFIFTVVMIEIFYTFEWFTLKILPKGDFHAKRILVERRPWSKAWEELACLFTLYYLIGKFVAPLKLLAWLRLQFFFMCEAILLFECKMFSMHEQYILHMKWLAIKSSLGNSHIFSTPFDQSA